ncbi:P-loop containing nucleoside triphosphate hydrolase protein [Rhizodiscina lignyota]|uniref:P-loop containing nucleoside triphosphate hydrolase protein n=1 Tax=Rhizodiscina lignyota TaxID=1504668 RepID=A0A9P4MCM5_9PEZI|nr:P-loop containing nucleoside triphosphate hydrolase protein [Rhizodiscina lignyota]
MEEQVDHLVKKTWEKYEKTPKSQRLLIGVSGIPGSGKTTLASIVAKRINELYHDHAPGCSCGNAVAAFIPMDGYHLSRAQLDAMPDPVTAHARRGAAFTFDGESFLHLVKKLKEPLLPESTTLYAPSFDHAVKDPVEDDIPISPGMRVIVFEGNYLSLNKSPWKDAAALMDELWFVEVDFDKSRQRLVSRHVKAGIARDEDEANMRVTENDHVNGEEIVEDRMDVDEVIISKEDELWKPEKQEFGK